MQERGGLTWVTFRVNSCDPVRLEMASALEVRRSTRFVAWPTETTVTESSGASASARRKTLRALGVCEALRIGEGKRETRA